MRWVIMLLVAVFSLTLVGCQEKADGNPEKAFENPDVRKIAWNSLSEEEQVEVIGAWKEAKVSKVVADTNRFLLKDKSFEGKEVNLVEFESKQQALLGNILILVDDPTDKVVGVGVRH